MILNNWPFVALSILAVGLTPGPSMLFGFAISTQFGFKRSLFAGAGVLSALSVYAALSLSGLGALLLAAPKVMTLLQWSGVAYLAWLGMQALVRFKHLQTVDIPQGLQIDSRSAKALFQQGLLTGLTNPKAVLFFSAIFPLFLDANAPFVLQGSLLYMTFVMSWMMAFFCYAMAGALMKKTTANTSSNRFMNLFTGVVYLSAAGMLAFRR